MRTLRHACGTRFGVLPGGTAGQPPPGGQGNGPAIRQRANTGLANRASPVQHGRLRTAIAGNAHTHGHSARPYQHAIRARCQQRLVAHVIGVLGFNPQPATNPLGHIAPGKATQRVTLGQQPLEGNASRPLAGSTDSMLSSGRWQGANGHIARKGYLCQSNTSPRSSRTSAQPNRLMH